MTFREIFRAANVESAYVHMMNAYDNAKGAMFHLCTCECKTCTMGIVCGTSTAADCNIGNIMEHLFLGVGPTHVIKAWMKANGRGWGYRNSWWVGTHGRCMVLVEKLV